jgi:hypothetical protein
MPDMRVARRIGACILLALASVEPAAAQYSSPGQLPEPLLRETPWGDFPLERLLPGARLRLTATDGRRVERRVQALRDSSLELQTPAGELLPPMSFTALHQYRTVEVRALPAWSERVGTPSAIGGALLGAITGAIVHNSRKPSSAAVHRPSRLDDIAGASTVGGLLGWEIGIQTLGRPR